MHFGRRIEAKTDLRHLYFWSMCWVRLVPISWSLACLAHFEFTFIRITVSCQHLWLMMQSNESRQLTTNYVHTCILIIGTQLGFCAIQRSDFDYLMVQALNRLVIWLLILYFPGYGCLLCDMAWYRLPGIIVYIYQKYVYISLELTHSWLGQLKCQHPLLCL